jgi:hypothetical protein
MIQNTHPPATSLFPGFTEFILIAVFFSALVSGGQMVSIDSDLGRHLTLGPG